MKSLLIVTIIFSSLASYAFDHSHKDLTTVLNKVVSYKGVGGAESVVDYKALKKDPATLTKYLGALSAVTKKEFDTFTSIQQQAFLGNAYNAFTLKLIIDNYPVKSIKKIGGLFSSPWKIKFVPLLGKKMTLDEIEHETLRKDYKEPRIHFVVNCASVGCPRLRNEAFTADKWEAQLQEQTKIFMRDTSRNKIDTKKKKVKISKIFDWFEEDFEKGPTKSVQEFIAPYITDDPAVQASLKKGEYDVDHLSYSWDLNEK